VDGRDASASWESVLIDRGQAVDQLDRPRLDRLAAEGTTLEDFFIANTR